MPNMSKTSRSYQLADRQTGVDRFHFVVFGSPAFHAEAQIPFDGVEQVDDFKAGIGGRPIDAGDAAEADECLLVFKKTADLENGFRGDENGRFVAIVVAAQDRRAEALFDRRGDGRVFQRIGNHCLLLTGRIA